MRGAGWSAAARPRGGQLGAGPTRRGRGRQDGLLAYVAEQARRAGPSGSEASSLRWSLRSRGCISCARPCSTASRVAQSAAGCAASRVRASGWRRAGSLHRRPCDLEPVAGAAEAQPLVCLVDDTQWLDRASVQTLAFVSRRLLAERIAIVFAVREPNDVTSSAACRSWSSAASPTTTQPLLASAMPGRLDERVRDQIVAETRGNPLALLELPRGLTLGEFGGGRASRRAAAGQPCRGAFLQRVRALAAETQLLLLVAAAEPVGDVSLLWRAAERLGIRGDAGKPAEEAALIDSGSGFGSAIRSSARRSTGPLTFGSPASASSAGRSDRSRDRP